MPDTREPDDPRATPVTLRRDLLAQGWTDTALASMVRSGQWVRPRRGAYVEARAWAAAGEVGRHEITARAVLQQAKSDAVLSHLSAAAVWDLSFWDLTPNVVHLSRPDGKCGRTAAGVTQHHGLLLDEDVATRHGLPVVSATRLALELPHVVDLEHAHCFASELLHRGETTGEQLRARYAGMSTWPGSIRTDLVIRLAEARCESVGERRFLFLCFRQHLPAPVCQFPVEDGGRVVARLDFAWPELGVYAEFDGRVKYSKLLRPGQDPAAVVVAEKEREDQVRELTGWRGLRVSWADLYQPERTAERVRRLIGAVSMPIGA